MIAGRWGAEDEVVIGWPHHVAYDCPDPLALATFSPALLDLPVTFTSPDWPVVALGATRLDGATHVHADRPATRPAWCRGPGGHRRSARPRRPDPAMPTIP